MLSEEVQKRKIQMKNASKNLMKVDEFLYNLQIKTKNDKIDQEKLNEAITDLRDAINMLNMWK